jgi:hypothetical protein
MISWFQKFLSYGSTFSRLSSDDFLVSKVWFPMGQLVRAYQVMMISRFQKFAFEWVNVYRYAACVSNARVANPWWRSMRLRTRRKTIG